MLPLVSAKTNVSYQLGTLRRLIVNNSTAIPNSKSDMPSNAKIAMRCDDVDVGDLFCLSMAEIHRKMSRVDVVAAWENSYDVWS